MIRGEKLIARATPSQKKNSCEMIFEFEMHHEIKYSIDIILIVTKI